MSFKMILISALIIITIAMLLNLTRVVKGPSIADRVQALDSIGINIISGIAVFSILLQTHAFFDLILLIGILSFIGTIAFARFMERRIVIERKH